MTRTLTALATVALSAALSLGGPALADTPPAKVPAPAGAPVATTATMAPDLPVEAIFDERMNTGPMAGVYAALARHFPNEAAAMRAQMIATISAELASGAPLSDGLDQGRQLLARLAPLLSAASDADLMTILDDQIALYAALRSSPRDCARVVIDGMTVEDFTDPRLAGHDFAARTDQLYGTMAAARNHPARPAAEQGHYVSLVAMLAGDAAGQAALASIERLDPADPALCDGAIRFFEALRDARFPGADRLRAEMLVGLMTG